MKLTDEQIEDLNDAWRERMRLLQDAKFLDNQFAETTSNSLESSITDSKIIAMEAEADIVWEECVLKIFGNVEINKEGDYNDEYATCDCTIDGTYTFVVPDGYAPPVEPVKHMEIKECFWQSNDWYFDVVNQMKKIFHQNVPDKPTELDEETRQLRFNLCWEEFKEMMEGLGYKMDWLDISSKIGEGEPQDLVKLLDGACDLIVVVLGTLAAAGINPHTAWKEVHRTNLAKAGGPVREDGKKLKPSDWQPPNIEKCLIDQGWEKSER